MFSKRNSTSNLASSSDEDAYDGDHKAIIRKSGRKKTIQEQTFRIHSNEFVTTSNRDERKKVATTIALDADKTENEIRNILNTELPQLKDKSYTFFTKDKEGNRYFCPCSLQCKQEHSPVEWNGRNIRRAAKSNRSVYILIKEVREEPSTSESFALERHSETGYESVLTESSASAPSAEVFFPLQDEELQPYLQSISSPSTPELLTEIINEELARTPIVIEEIVPKEGSVEGLYTFFLTLAAICMLDDAHAQFGDTDPIPVGRIDDTTLKGKVPPSFTPGEVQVQLVNVSGDPISSTIPFTYIDENVKKKDVVKQNIGQMDMNDLQEMLIKIANRMGEMSVNSEEETNQSGSDKMQALSLLRLIADIAAKINAIDFFRILFSTHVGRVLFKSFKDEEELLEETARRNGHEHLACLLEQKHLMYRDDEDESDDEVDWKELAKAIEKYQAMNDEMAEKKSISSISSSNGYLGDGESSLSLSSLNILATEGCPENAFDEQQTTPESKNREEPESFKTHVIEDGMSERGMDTTSNATSSSDNLRIVKTHKLKEDRLPKGEESVLVHIPSVVCTSVSNYPMFAPKEVASLRKKLESFDDGQTMHLYPDREQTIYNVMERLDASFALDFLEEPRKDLKERLKVWWGSGHPDLAEGVLYTQKNKDTKGLSLPQFSSNCKTDLSLLNSPVSSETMEQANGSVASEDLSCLISKEITPKYWVCAPPSNSDLFEPFPDHLPKGKSVYSSLSSFKFKFLTILFSVLGVVSVIFITFGVIKIKAQCTVTDGVLITNSTQSVMTWGLIVALNAILFIISIMWLAFALRLYRSLSFNKGTSLPEELPLLTKKTIDKEFKWDAFIIFCHEDKHWVRETLLPLLEEKHSLKCCIHFRDFEPGRPLVEAMSESIYQSCKIIAVLSSNFLKSNYCSYEINIAKDRLLKRQDDCLVVIRIDKGSECHMLPRALRERNFIDYSESLERPQWESKLLSFFNGQNAFSHQDDRVPSAIIKDLSRYLNPGDRWKQLARRLDFNSTQINNFAVDPSNATQVMLQEWAKRDGATVEALQSTFRKMNWSKEEKIVGAYFLEMESSV